MKATEVWSYSKISKSITSEQILNECAIMAAGEALLLYSVGGGWNSCFTCLTLPVAVKESVSPK